MLPALIQFLVCAIVIVIAGTFLSKYADAIAEFTGLGRLVIGSVLLAGATSLPEMTVDISAVRLGATDLAVGDLLGSSLMNLLILALLDLSHHSRGRMLSRQSAAHALAGSLAAALAALVGIGLLTGQALAPYTLLGISPVIYLVAIVYFLGVRLVYFDQMMAMKTAVDAGHPVSHHAPGMTIAKAIGGFALCALAIFIAGPFLASASDQLAEKSGLGGTFVGTTLVAFSTSLPELVSSLAALRMGAHDLAIGNVYGSNAFNMLLLVPLDVVQSGSLLATVAPGHTITCVAAILATQVAVMGQLYQAESRKRLIEPDALMVILTVIGALALVYYVR